MAGPLTDAELAVLAESLPLWEVNRHQLRRTWPAPSFLAAVDAIVRIAELAEAANHHPDIDLRYRTLGISLSTHSAGHAVTSLDAELAARIEALLQGSLTFDSNRDGDQ